MSFRSRLIGSWELVSYTATNAEDPSDVQYPLTESAKGMIMYSSDGYMSAHLGLPDPLPYKNGPFSGATEELSTVANGLITYMGPYYLEEKGDGAEDIGVQHLFHEMKVCVPPNWLGNVQERPARMEEKDGDLLLHLTGRAIPVEGTLRSPKLTWRKLKDNANAKPPGKG